MLCEGIKMSTWRILIFLTISGSKMIDKGTHLKEMVMWAKINCLNNLFILINHFTIHLYFFKCR